MAEKKSEIVEKPKGGALAVPDYGMEPDAGFENVGSADIVLPFLQVLQSNSPQVEQGTLEGAKAGMLHNTVTNELVDGKTGVIFVPACTEHYYGEWVPRNQGGGFVGVHAVDSELVKRSVELSEKVGQPFGKVFTKFDEKGNPIGNQLTETFAVYGVVVGADGSVTPVVLSFSSTKIGVYKRWMTSLKLFQPKARIPLCAHQVRVATTRQENAKGVFYNLVMGPATGGSLAESLLNPKVERDAEILEAAKSVREAVRNGLARVAYETQTAESAPASTAGGAEGEDGVAPF